MNILARLLAAAALAIASLGANATVVTATQYVALTSSVSSSGTTSYSTGFSAVHTVAGAFTDTFVFSGLTGQALVNSILITIAGGVSSLNIDFISATINGVSYTISSSTTATDLATLASTVLTGTITLVVQGIAGVGLATGTSISASYAGTINATKIPEPATLALVAMALAAVVFIRRRAAKADRA